MVVTTGAIAMLLESNPLDISGAASSGYGSVHYLSRGKIGVGYIDAAGSSKMLAIATFPSKKVVSNPNLIDQQAPKHGFEGITYVVLQP